MNRFVHATSHRVFFFGGWSLHPERSDHVSPYLRAEFERHRQRLSQREVGERANPKLHQATVSAIESGRIVPTPVELAALAQVLGVSDPAALLLPVRFVESEGVARG